MILKNSKKMINEAKNIIPALSQTFSKAPYSYVEDVYPTFLSRGNGSHVYDVDNNEYIDYVLGLGPIILGYNYSKINQAIKHQLKNGISFSIPHRLELDASKVLQSIIPGADMVRFSKTGSDAGTAAIRAARALTKRNNIAYWGGGGVWHDWFTVITSRNQGIPTVLKDMIKKFEYNNIESLKILFENWHGEVAAIYMEPMITEYPEKNFLYQVKKLAHKHGSIFIFDEVMTGFRLSNGGAQEFLKINADISVFGKGIANGMPLGAITGKHEFMKIFDDIFYSTTYGGETLSLAAMMAVIKELKTKPIIEHNWNLGKHFISEFNKLSTDLEIDIKLEGIPVRSFITCRDKKGKPSKLLKSLFYQEMIRRGVLFGSGAVLLSYSHTKKDIQQTLEACKQSMKIVKKAIQTKSVQKFLKGKVMKQVMTF
ncbi:MAG: putative 3-aminobutyryl-CoA aminotransferase [Nitrosopumilales archaeon]|nr:MAG: putative 3-aminobutyryl-CoA aminotransferase [Nitrosopumilales archaeon]